jgi:hypothetical protein
VIGNRDLIAIAENDNKQVKFYKLSDILKEEEKEKEM